MTWATSPAASTPMAKSSATGSWSWPPAPSLTGPKANTSFKQNPNVFLSWTWIRRSSPSLPGIRNAQAAAFIQCVGSRVPERPYCNKVCCTQFRGKRHQAERSWTRRGMSISSTGICGPHGERETLYHQGPANGVVFIRYQRSGSPPVEEADGCLKITVMDQILGRPVELTVDLLSLATAIIPHQNARWPRSQGAPQRRRLFHRGPRQDQAGGAATEGIFLAGPAIIPNPSRKSVAEALACASRANTILSKDFLELESIISNPVDENCDGCAFCIDACPFTGPHSAGIHEGRQRQRRSRSTMSVQGLRLLHGHLSQAGHRRGRIHPGTTWKPGGGGLRIDLRLTKTKMIADSQGFNHGRSIRTADHRLLLQLVLLCRSGPGRGPAFSIPPTAASSG